MAIKDEMSGTPWHIERMTRQEGDERRYKGRCRFYSYEDNFCKVQMFKCTGSAHCDYYEGISDEEFKKRQAKNQKKISKSKDDDRYWF